MTSTLVLFQLKQAQIQEIKPNVSMHIRKQNSHLNNAAGVAALQNSITQMVKQPKFLQTAFISKRKLRGKFVSIPFPGSQVNDCDQCVCGLPPYQEMCVCKSDRCISLTFQPPMKKESKSARQKQPLRSSCVPTINTLSITSGQPIIAVSLARKCNTANMYDQRIRSSPSHKVNQHLASQSTSNLG